MEPRLSHRKESLTAWLYLAPAGILLLVFFFLPVAVSVVASFTNWEGGDTIEIVSWTGTRNYERTLGDREFMMALVNTIHYVVFSVPVTLAISLGLALLVHRRLRGSAIFRTVFFLPYVTTWVSISIVWRMFFDPRVGPLNYLLQQWFGMDALQWLQEPRGVIEMIATDGLGIPFWRRDSATGYVMGGPSLAMTSIILTSVWRDVGFGMVLFLAGLNNINPAWHEAARMDGAGAWKRFRHITWPLLTPTTYFLVVVSLIGAFRVLVPVLVMTPDGGPGRTTSTLIFYMYQKGFAEWKLGLACAVAYLFFLIVFLLTMAQNRLFGSRVEYET